MLNTISWQQYITVVTLLSILWYLFVAFRYYRPEITARLNIRRSSRPALVAYPSVMGPVKTDNETAAAEELLFGASATDDISDSSLPAGPTDELVAQTQTLIQTFTDTPNKAEFLSLLGVLLSKYEPYEDEIDLKALRPLAAQLPFAIEEQEWPTFKN